MESKTINSFITSPYVVDSPYNLVNNSIRDKLCTTSHLSKNAQHLKFLITSKAFFNDCHRHYVNYDYIYVKNDEITSYTWLHKRVRN